MLWVTSHGREELNLGSPKMMNQICRRASGSHDQSWGRHSTEDWLVWRQWDPLWKWQRRSLLLSLTNKSWDKRSLRNGGPVERELSQVFQSDSRGHKSHME